MVNNMKVYAGGKFSSRVSSSLSRWWPCIGCEEQCWILVWCQKINYMGLTIVNLSFQGKLSINSDQITPRSAHLCKIRKFYCSWEFLVHLIKSVHLNTKLRVNPCSIHQLEYCSSSIEVQFEDLSSNSGLILGVHPIWGRTWRTLTVLPSISPKSLDLR